MAHSLKDDRLEHPKPSVVHVVDDDEAVRDSMRALLETHGFEVRDYASASEFLVGSPLMLSGCVPRVMFVTAVKGTSWPTLPVRF